MKDRASDPGVRSFLQGLEAAVTRRSVVTHPFYQLWTEGRLPRPVLADYAKQFYAQVRAFPTYLSAVHSCCGEIRVRQRLLENLIEEERGEDNHPELWLRFAESLGLKRDETRSATLLPTTLESINLMRDLTHRNDYREGIAALWAYESQIPALFALEREALAKHYGFADARALGVFGANGWADTRHSRELQEILVSHCLTDESRSRATQAAGSAARTLWNFVDGLYATCVPDAIRGEAVHN